MMTDQKEIPPEKDSISSQESKAHTTGKDEKLQFKEQQADSDEVASVKTDTSNIVTKSFGIRRSELVMAQMTQVWQKPLFCFTIFLGMYVVGVENRAVSTLVGYATNSYREHSLLSTIRIVRYVAGAGAYPFFARAADVFGRLQMFLISVLFRIVGLIIQAKAENVQKYCAGTVIYGIGSTSTVIIWQLCIADATSLRYRLLFQVAMSFPTVINTWSVGEIMTLLVEKHSWSFGIALWAYVSTIVFLPFTTFYLVLLLKARRTQTWKEIDEEEHHEYIAANPSAKRAHEQLAGAQGATSKLIAYIKVAFVSIVDGLWTVLWAIDLIGILLLVITMGLLLVPLTLAGGNTEKWRKAYVIVPLVLVAVSIPLFVVWETKITKKPMIPYKLMRDRGVWSALLIGLFTTFTYTMPNAFAYPVLLVGMNATVTVATRTPMLALFTEGVSTPIFALMIVKFRRTKALIFIGVVMMFLSMGLFVRFRGANDGIHAKYFRDGVAISMCFQGVADACLLRMAGVSLQSCTNHEYMASVIAMFSLSYYVGSAVGSCVSGAIWTQQMYGTILKKMNELGVNPEKAMDAYAAPYTFIKTETWGTPARRAVSMAYAEIQKKLSIVGVCLCVVLLGLVFCLRDHRLPDAQNLGDEGLSSIDEERGETERVAARDKTQIVFTDDEDYILDFMKRVFSWKKSAKD